MSTSIVRSCAVDATFMTLPLDEQAHFDHNAGRRSEGMSPASVPMSKLQRHRTPYQPYGMVWYSSLGLAKEGR
jgi:hypothetical protein